MKSLYIIESPTPNTDIVRRIADGKVMRKFHNAQAETIIRYCKELLGL